MHFMVLLMVTGSLFSLISQYHMYWALDERVIPCGYAYPPAASAGAFTRR